MIEPTDEMRAAVRAVLDQPFASDGDVVAAVLAIVQQRYVLRPVMCDHPHPGEDLAYCELPRGHDGEHETELTKVVRW